MILAFQDKQTHIPVAYIVRRVELLLCNTALPNNHIKSCAYLVCETIRRHRKVSYNLQLALYTLITNNDEDICCC